MENDIQNLKNSANKLTDAIMAVAARPAPKATILDRELSGNKINGGIITNFSSIGIKDLATEPTLIIKNNVIEVDKAAIKTITCPLTIKDSLSVEGTIKAEKLHVNELVADVRQERSTNLEFKPENNSLNGKGLVWTGQSTTKQLIFRDNTPRFWSSEDFDLYKDKNYKIDNFPVLGFNYLGDSVIKSSLKKLGIVENLQTEGDLNIDNFIFFNSTDNTLGIGTDISNGIVSIASLDSQFIIDESNDKGFKIGTYSSSNLNIVTDDTVRISIAPTGTISLKNKVIVDGKIGINVKNFNDDVDLTVASGIRFSGKKFEVSDSAPTVGSYSKGDIVWNSNPNPTGFVGWVCVREGMPGVWKAFGNIQQ